MPLGTNENLFILMWKVLEGRTVTYGRIVDQIWLQKSVTYRNQLTVVGNLINFPGDIITLTADLTTSKLTFNSVLLTKVLN